MDKKIETYIKKIEPQIKDLLKKANTGGHDVAHFKRTMNTALYISSKEGGDQLVIAIAAYLHDIHRLMQQIDNRYVKPSESLPLVEQILHKSSINLSKKEIDKILFAISHHEDYNWDGNNVDDLNTLIIQDADNLDAIGAIGIARAFKYAGVNNQVMYDESIPLEDFKGYEEKVKDVSTIHFFNNKLIKLGNNMNTKTAKTLADKRVNFVKAYIKEFLAEWHANYED